jgi:C-terminal processing protease CtpA/Prc
VSAFDWDDKQRYLRFTHECFARLKAERVTQLVIDVSANGGGNDDMWMEGILRYIADRPYKHASRYIKRERTGEVTQGAVASEIEPDFDEPLRFDGHVTVLIGPKTYSSAVLFSNVVQDYGFARLAGTGGAARTRQSGGVQSITLPSTGLMLAFPRFVLERPSGAREPSLLEPDSSEAETVPPLR